MRVFRLIMIVGMIGILCLLCISCADSTPQSSSANLVYAEGYFLKMDEDNFFIADGDSLMFTDKEFIKIHPLDETVTFDGLGSGDRIGVEVETVADLYPRMMYIHRIELIEKGDISNIDATVISQLNELGFRVSG